MRHILADKGIVALTAILVGLSLFFLLFPDVDLQVSSLFYDIHDDKFFADQGIWRVIRTTGRIINVIVSVLWIGLFLFTLVFHKKYDALVLKSFRKASSIALMTLTVAVGLIVNGILKSFWGRARPVQISDFGGEKVFTPVWYITDQCERNCSFMSGESAAGAWIALSIVLLLMALREIKPDFVTRRVFMTGLVVAGIWMVAMGWLRLAAGGHFLSDVLMGASVTLLFCRLFMVMFPKEPTKKQ